jgi:hypothetical protein
MALACATFRKDNQARRKTNIQQELAKPRHRTGYINLKWLIECRHWLAIVRNQPRASQAVQRKSNIRNNNKHYCMSSASTWRNQFPVNGRAHAMHSKLLFREQQHAICLNMESSLYENSLIILSFNMFLPFCTFGSSALYFDCSVCRFTCPVCQVVIPVCRVTA